MPKLSEARKRKLNLLKEKARDLYEQGYTMKEIAEYVGKSLGWVHNAIHEKVVHRSAEISKKV